MIDRETATLRDTVVAFIHKSLSSRNNKGSRSAKEKKRTFPRFKLLIESSIEYPPRVSFGGFTLAVKRVISDSHHRFTRLRDAIDDR